MTAAARKIQVEISGDVAEFLHRKVATGGFADEESVVAQALEDAAEADTEIERWLKDQVVPTLDKMQQEGRLRLSPQDVRAELEKRRHARQPVA